MAKEWTPTPPHSHTLIWCKLKIRSEDVDKIISAELPDEEYDPELFETIKAQPIHSPRGVIHPDSPCMQDKKCIKRYLKACLRETQTDNDSYILYRRRKPGTRGVESTTLRVRGEDITLANQWVVPYNILLCKILKAHINMEYCSSVKAIYVFHKICQQKKFHGYFCYSWWRWARWCEEFSDMTLYFE